MNEMRSMLVEVDGLVVEVPLDTLISSIINNYEAIIDIGSEMNVIEYRNSTAKLVSEMENFDARR